MSNFRLCAACGACVFAASSALAVDGGALSDFQDLTQQGWEGRLDYMTVKNTGGPGGGGDAYLRVFSDGNTVPGSPGSRLAIDTGGPEWTGDYLAAGITGIEADFLNLGATPLEMRVVLFQSAANRYTSTTASIIPADGLWHHAVFPINEASFTSVMGSLTYHDMITDVTELMFRHNAGAPAAGGTPVFTTGGFDNIHMIPAPGVLGAAGLVGLAGLRRRR
ncbi:MAG: hypothetical protein U0637_10505 [Phycisphaerales bacterium]